MRPSPIASLLVAALLGFGYAALPAADKARTAAPPADATAVTESAQAFLLALDPERKKLASMPFDDKRRLDWHYVPRTGHGLALKDMTDPERRAARRLLESVLSVRGRLKVEAIMALERVLFDLESKPGAAADHRNLERYWFAIFGTPGGDSPWALRIEGHHVSLSFAIEGKRLVAHTPFFLGANPAEVLSGPSAGLRVLAEEEDLARALVRSLDANQSKAAVSVDPVPADVLFGPGKSILDTMQGIAADGLNAAQQTLLWRLIREFAGDLRDDAAAEEILRIEAAGFEKVHFLWIGATTRGRGHYYRIQGPTFVIEYDNTQNDARHIHVLWRDPERDFGPNPLRDHLKK